MMDFLKSNRDFFKSFHIGSEDLVLLWCQFSESDRLRNGSHSIQRLALQAQKRHTRFGRNLSSVRFISLEFV